MDKFDERTIVNIMFRYGVDRLTVAHVIDICNHKLQGCLDAFAKDQVKQSRRRVEAILESTDSIYGVNTGFGPLCDTTISTQEVQLLQRNLLISHAVGVGEAIDPIISKAMLICKLHVLALGYSGIRIEVLERILFFIDNDLIPVVPEKGSVGASGDLAPLSHLFLPLIGEGEFWIQEKKVSASSVLSNYNLTPLTLAAKEGLALINGTQFILAHAVMGLDHMKYLIDLADVSGALSVEGLQGSAAPFRPELHQLRPFKGSIQVAERIWSMLENSENMNSHEDCLRVQDPYSLRCMPQVHGATRNAYEHLLQLTEIELNSVTDNPVILTDGDTISGGNFHGQPLAMALDYACIAASELSNISDRRCYLMSEGKYGLPRFLTRHAGTHSGMMIPQYATAALVSENKSLCYPASADSIPTSIGQEDHVSMGSISGRKFCQVLSNVAKVIAIEILYACQAMDFRRPLHFSPFLEQVHSLIRAHIDFLDQDRMLKNDIDCIINLVDQRSIPVAQIIK